LKYKVVTLAAMLSASASAVDVSTNIGYATQYHYRGIYQHTNSISAGIDVAEGNLSAGIWAADVGDGAEVDVYSSYGIDLGDLSVSVGATGYYYTGDFDETYEEVNLGASYSFLSVEHSIGRWEEQDYTFSAVTAEYEGFYLKYGEFGEDFEGDYAEVGYGYSFSGLDFGVSAIKRDWGGSTSYIATIGKTF
jgi:uncharacterized protein (TIGR02001 family)|tara:strand:+ start:982 stop:1557 length:576 start_codon:yes stop_codon:yes gene_type:complete